MIVVKQEDVMERAACASRRRYSGLLAAALAALSACGKKKDAGRSETLSPPAAASDSALVDRLAGQPSAQPGEILPAWAREKPHFFEREGRRYASAVGRARVRDAALARAAAEDRARGDLLRLIAGGAPGAAIEGSLLGSRMTDSFTSKEDGQVFVRVEVQAAPRR
jgi:hypothetical protein